MNFHYCHHHHRLSTLNSLCDDLIYSRAYSKFLFDRNESLMDDWDAPLSRKVLALPAQAFPAAGLKRSRPAPVALPRAGLRADPSEDRAEASELADTDDGGSSSDSAEESAPTAAAAAPRRRKGAPAELPSTRGVSRVRPIFRGARVAERRDPRFDDACGVLDETKHATAYAFLDEMRADESAALSVAAKRARAGGDVAAAAELEAELTRRRDAARTAARRAEAAATAHAQKKAAQAAVASGAAPFYPKARDLAQLEAVERFKALEASGTGAVERALTKKRTSLAHKDRKRLPPRANHE